MVARASLSAYRPHSLATRPFSRRRFLGSLGMFGTGIAGAALIGCGAGSDKPGMVATPPSTAVVSPKRGGIWNLGLFSDPPTLDPHATTSSTAKMVAAASYSRLFAYESGPDVPKVNFNTVPDAATGIEVIDAQTYAVTLDAEARFTAPLHRAMTAQDVRASFNRYRASSTRVSGGSDADLVSMIEEVEAPDAQTAVFHLKEPYAAFAQVLADPRSLQIMPAEASREFDPARMIVGSGPWLLREYRPGETLSFTRNPEWHGGPELPYFDALEMQILTDASAMMSHFLNGNLDALTLGATDATRVLEAVPGVQLVSNDVSSINTITFSGIETDGPWRDVRVRRAVSMSLNRDEMLDQVYGLQGLRDVGLEAPSHWNGFLPWGITGYWLDPRRMRPENAAAFTYDPEEAAKLLAAAGITEPIDPEWHYTNGYRGGYGPLAEMTPRYLGAVGIEVRAIVEDFGSVFIPQTFTGNFQGLASVAYGLGEPGNYLADLYLPDSIRNTGKIDDAELAEMARTIQANTNTEERREQILAAQEYLATQMYNVPLPLGPTFTAYQPTARNVVAYQTHGQAASVDQLPRWWRE